MATTHFNGFRVAVASAFEEQLTVTPKSTSKSKLRKRSTSIFDNTNSNFKSTKSDSISKSNTLTSSSSTISSSSSSSYEYDSDHDNVYNDYNDYQVLHNYTAAIIAASERRSEGHTGTVTRNKIRSQSNTGEGVRGGATGRNRFDGGLIPSHSSTKGAYFRPPRDNNNDDDDNLSRSASAGKFKSF